MNDYHPSGDCWGSYGLFQIACIHSENPLYDPEENIDMAYKLYQERGWEPWGVCDFEKTCQKLLSTL